MARTVRNAKLDTRSARASSTRLRKAPYWHAIAPGFALGYRKASKGGVWLAKLVKPGLRKETTLGPADDALNPDGVHIFSFAQAQEKARDWKARVENEHVGGPKKKLITIGEAIDSYEADLKARGGDVGNVGRLRVHVTGDLLDKAVAALVWTDLREWRDGLVKTPRKKRKAAAPPEKLSPAAINRTCAAFKAALNRVADDPDQHIPSRHAWEHGLESIPDAEQARNVILSDSVVLQITADSYKTSAEFGLFIEIHAVTGARPDQIRKLTVYDLQADRPDPRLMMPPSKKGKKGITKKPCPVPIPAEFAKRLKALTRDRPPSAQLLTKPSGEQWKKSDHDRLFDRVVKRCGLSDWEALGYPAKITLYALRHSDIVRQIKANVPPRIIAVTHDTSIPMIERNYSRHIGDHTDAISRPALLDTSKLFRDQKIAAIGGSRAAS